MSISKKELKAIYRRRAKHYDFSSRIYHLLGLDIEAYRVRAIDCLKLKRGDCVLDLGCGTGMNLELLLDRIGANGRLIGVDFSSHMLARAKEKVKKHKWRNVEFVKSDIEAYEFPPGLDGVLATNVFGFIRQYDAVIKRAAAAIAPGGRMVIQDGKQPANWPVRLFRLATWLGRPYGITRAFYAGRPWEAVEKYFRHSWMEEMYFGLEYISYGQNGANSGGPASHSHLRGMHA